MENLHQVGATMASLDMEQTFDQGDQQHKDHKQEIHKEEELHNVAKHRIKEHLHMVEEAKLHMVAVKPHKEEHHRVELPHITEVTHSQAPHKEVELHMAEELAIKMVKPYTQVDTKQVI